LGKTKKFSASSLKVTPAVAKEKEQLSVKWHLFSRKLVYSARRCNAHRGKKPIAKIALVVTKLVYINGNIPTRKREQVRNNYELGPSNRGHSG